MYIKGQAEHVLAFDEQCVVLTVTAGLVREWGTGGKQTLFENCF